MKRKILLHVAEYSCPINRHPDGIEIGPSELALTEWKYAGLKLPDLSKMREYRLNRIIEKLREANQEAILLFDPLNILADEKHSKEKDQNIFLHLHRYLIQNLLNYQK